MYRLVNKILFVALLIWLMPYMASAGFLDDVAYCTADGSCNLADIAVAFNSLIRLLLGGFGAAALLYFVWGGIQWLVSGGNLEKVARGRTIMLNTVFAMILAFGSYLVVSFFVNDFLRVKDDYRIEEGGFSSCEDAAAGTRCGDYKECVGVLPENALHASLSGKCLSGCQAQNINLPVLPECIASTANPTWQTIGGAGLCPSGQRCAIPPQQ